MTEDKELLEVEICGKYVQFSFWHFWVAFSIFLNCQEEEIGRYKDGEQTGLKVWSRTSPASLPAAWSKGWQDVRVVRRQHVLEVCRFVFIRLTTLDLKQLIYIFDLSASVFFCFCFFGLEMGVLQICTLQESTFQDWLKNKRWKYL